MQTGVMTSANVNLWRKQKTRPERFIPRDRGATSPEELEARLHQWARMHNAMVDRYGNNRTN